MAAIGFGETIGLYRFFGNQEGNGLQFSLQAALFAQFNLDTPSSDLINADYIIGLPITYKCGGNSLRLRIYHQSSHLGDEYLQTINPSERINLSYETIELIYSYDWYKLRIYAGGEKIYNRQPSDLKTRSYHLGMEFRGSKERVLSGRVISGLDMKSTEENNWHVDTSVKGGLEFGHSSPGQRGLRLTGEWYKGYDPHGQFYNNRVEYYGIALALSF